MYRTMGKMFGRGRVLAGGVGHATYTPETEFRQEVTINAEEYFAYRIWMPKFDSVKIHVEVLEGNDIDCLVMNEYNFGEYANGRDFIYMLRGSVLGIHIVNSIFVAQEEGMHYFVIDNTSFPDLGAKPCHETPDCGHVRVLFDARAHNPVQMVTDRPGHMTR